MLPYNQVSLDALLTPSERTGALDKGCGLVGVTVDGGDVTRTLRSCGTGTLEKKKGHVCMWKCLTNPSLTHHGQTLGVILILQILLLAQLQEDFL